MYVGLSTAILELCGGHEDPVSGARKHLTTELFSQLKNATAAFHRRLDAEIDVCGEGLTLDRYGSLLMRFHGIFSTLEPQLAAVRGLDELDFDPDLARCCRTGWLSEDLEVLCMSGTVGQPDASVRR